MEEQGGKGKGRTKGDPVGYIHPAKKKLNEEKAKKEKEEEEERKEEVERCKKSIWRHCHAGISCAKARELTGVNRRICADLETKRFTQPEATAQKNIYNSFSQ